MSYADRVNVNEKPACWGDGDSYDIRDADCSACSFQHTCRTEISRTSAAAMGSPRVASAYTPSSPPPASTNRAYAPYRPQGAYNTPYRPQGGGVESACWAPGPISETDHPVTRFLKDGVAGAARGGFYEWYRFFQVFRLK
ncbi:hypothetical protein UFOVP276_81 [uncultured Caudovirales phage]|uniref:Uncharacterized protein n=1 Tax=uncultured Caudovirales phage TaxID=2100421 RepID=A0A6J5LJ88_9CAUD|nr:hypothetical protein UFOVP127_218 [uncultured Caudovirales phage]CAB4135123.1 hypothetical protein UFOVP276_81 [uncultured Caudovirales phage]